MSTIEDTKICNIRFTNEQCDLGRLHAVSRCGFQMQSETAVRAHFRPNALIASLCQAYRRTVRTPGSSIMHSCFLKCKHMLLVNGIGSPVNIFDGGYLTVGMSWAECPLHLFLFAFLFQFYFSFI